MLSRGDLVLALNHRLWASRDINKTVCYQKAVVIDVHHCENVPLEEPYRVMVDLIFENESRIARSYFVDYLVKLS